MSKFQVTTSELNSAISELTEKNGSFRTKVAELESLQQELSSQWQGEANTAFVQAFNADKGQWDVFAREIDNYIQTLQSIMQAYDKAEDINLNTAKIRNY